MKKSIFKKYLRITSFIIAMCFVILILVMIFSQNEQLVLWRMRLKHKVTAAFGAHRRKGA